MTMAKKNFSATKTIVPCRISFANIWQARSINGSEEKYSVSCLIPKSDKETLLKLHKAIEAAKEDGKIKKWGGKIPTNLKLARECREEITHSADEWSHILTVAEEYEEHCKRNNVSNGIVKADTEYIRNLYQELSRDHRI